MHQALQSTTAGVNLTHEVGRGPVARLRKSPNEGYHLPGSCAVGIARCPKRSAHAISTLCIQHERFGCVAVFKCHDVDKGFHCRTDLSSTGHGHIILEMGIIETTHIGFDKPVARIDRHEPGTQKRFIIANRIEGRHHSVHIAVVSVDRHRCEGAERIVNFLFARAGGFHGLVAFALAHGTIEDALDLFRRETGVEREILAILPAIELGLELQSDVIEHSFLSILLHTRIDGGVNLQAVGINIVVGAISFLVLFAPTVKGVVDPSEGVSIVLSVLPFAVIGALGFICHEHLAEILTKVGGFSLFVIDGVEVQFQGTCTQGTAILGRQEAGLDHLRQNHVATLTASLSIAHRIEQRGILTHPDQCCGLGDGQFTGRFPKIDIGSRLNSHGIVQKIEVVEIQRHDLILRIVAFNLNCDHPFDGLLQ